jgi:hypothetical protein
VEDKMGKKKVPVVVFDEADYGIKKWIPGERPLHKSLEMDTNDNTHTPNIWTLKLFRTWK